MLLNAFAVRRIKCPSEDACDSALFWSCVHLLTADRVRRITTDSPNAGPNPEGFGPKPWGLLDFQDVAIFLWPDKREFEIQEQCLILKHRNAKLRDLTPEDLNKVREWISGSRTIDAEEQKVDLRAWRKGLKPKELKKLIQKMEADLKSARGMKEAQEREEKRRNQQGLVEEKHKETVSPSVNHRKRRLVIEDSDDE